MPALLTIDVDASSLFMAMDQAVDAIAMRAHENALRSAHNVAREARARVRRRTGATAEGITVTDEGLDKGVLVTASRQQFPNLPAWLEFGTKHMSAKAFFVPSVKLEEGAFFRGAEEALREGIAESGLGE